MKHRQSELILPQSPGRREFLRQATLASLALGTAAGMPLKALAQSSGSSCQRVNMPRTLINFMLKGGADLRFLFMPAPDHPNNTYLDLIWPARNSLYSNAYANYQQMFDNEYLLTSDPSSGKQFGIYHRAAWLKEEFDAGRVAVIANAYCSRNRRHDQSILNANAGEPDLKVLNTDRDGWGGRLVELLGNNSNSVELSNAVSTFNKGSIGGARLQHVVHAQDMRDLALAGPDENAPITNPGNILARALRAYYKTRGAETQVEKPSSWPYHAPFQHSAALWAFGDGVNARLDDCQSLPQELVSLQLGSQDFTQQCRNLYDVCQVPDALGLGVLSMNYDGWDTHNNQLTEIGSNLEDIFGTDAGLATTMRAIRTLPEATQTPASQLVFYFASDFGRQLLANGAAGTDHGRGTYSILIGEALKGGIYGDLFPDSEARPDGNGQVPLTSQGTDIEGLTSTERILAAATNWVQAGAGNVIFPNAATSGLEPGVSLDTLFRA